MLYLVVFLKGKRYILPACVIVGKIVLFAYKKFTCTVQFTAETCFGDRKIGRWKSRSKLQRCIKSLGTDLIFCSAPAHGALTLSGPPFQDDFGDTASGETSVWQSIKKLYDAIMADSCKRSSVNRAVARLLSG